MAYQVFLDRRLGFGFERYGSYGSLGEAVSEACRAGTSRKCPRYVLTPGGQELDPFNPWLQRACLAESAR